VARAVTALRPQACQVKGFLDSRGVCRWFPGRSCMNRGAEQRLADLCQVSPRVRAAGTGNVFRTPHHSRQIPQRVASTGVTMQTSANGGIHSYTLAAVPATAAQFGLGAIDASGTAATPRSKHAEGPSAQPTTPRSRQLKMRHSGERPNGANLAAGIKTNHAKTLRLRCRRP
jgi:hypothetical protein